VCADIRPLRLLASDPGAIVETTPRVHSTYFGFSSSGSLAMLAAIRRASSCVTVQSTQLASHHRPAPNTIRARHEPTAPIPTPDLR
jgi:hypothetical protein